MSGTGWTGLAPSGRGFFLPHPTNAGRLLECGTIPAAELNAIINDRLLEEAA
jgi:hypothetical protein